jgi:hypothetical protein
VQSTTGLLQHGNKRVPMTDKNINGGSGNGKLDPFDPAALRLSQDFVGMSGVKKELVTVRVRKPGKQEWFRVHPGEDYRLSPLAMINLKEEGEYYVVDPSVYEALANEVIFVSLYTVITRQGVVTLWPIPLPAADGKDNEWWISAREAATRAMTQWVRVVANKSNNANDVFTGPPSMAEPDWPDRPFRDLLEIAFGRGYRVDSLTHPVVKRLQGLA